MLKKIVWLVVIFLLPVTVLAQNGSVKSHTKISSATSSLGNGDDLKLLGLSSCMIGDLDGDGVNEIAARAFVGMNSESWVYIFKLNANGTVKSGYTRLGRNTGGINLPSTSFSDFGSSITNMGDLNGNGVDDLVLGASSSQYILIAYMNKNASADSFKKITYGTYNFYDPLTPSSGRFGCAVANIGDLDHNGVSDIAVGDYGDEGYKGSVRILFLNANHTVKSVQKIGDSKGGFISLPPQAQFGESITSLGDLNKDGNTDILVGSQGNGSDSGWAYTLFLNNDGTVKNYYQYKPGTTSFPDGGKLGDFFAYSCANIGDIDGDSVSDVAIAAPQFDTLGDDKGRIWVMLLKRDGSIKAYQRIDGYLGGLNATIDTADNFGISMCPIGDFDGDGVYDLCVAASADDDADNTNSDANSGALYFLHLNGVPINPTNSVSHLHANTSSPLKLYPNPSKNKVTVISQSGTPISFITITDLTGKIVGRQQIKSVLNTSVNMSWLAQGTYILYINNTPSTYTRFTKE